MDVQRGQICLREAGERAAEMLNGTRFRVGTGTFLRLPKYLYSSNRQLQVLRIRRSELLTLRHGSGAGTRPRTLLLFTFHPGCGGGGRDGLGG